MAKSATQALPDIANLKESETAHVCAAIAYIFCKMCALPSGFCNHYEEINMSIQPGIEPDRIDVNDDAACEHWAKKLDTTKMQLHDAVAVVGNKATDVEMHLKGSRSTTNDDRIEELGG